MSTLDTLIDRLEARLPPLPDALASRLHRVDPASFVADRYRFLAYEDVPVPYAEASEEALLPSRRWVCIVYQLLEPAKAEDLLLMGSDGGYLAAILAAGRGGRRVVVVESDADLREATRRNLDRAGYGGRVQVRSDPPNGPFARILRRSRDDAGFPEIRSRLRDGGFLLAPRRTAQGYELLKVLRADGEFAELSIRAVAAGPEEGTATAGVHLGGLLALEELLGNVWRGVTPTAQDLHFLEQVETTFEGGPWDRGELQGEEVRRFRLAKKLFRLAHIHQMTGDLENAERLYRRSLEAYETAEAHTFLGWTYSFLDRLPDAVLECRKAIHVDSSLGNPYNDIGAYLIQEGRFEESVAWFRRALRAPRYCCYFYAHCNLGRAYLAKGEWEAARQAFEDALEANPGYALARRLLAEAERRLGSS